MLSRDSSSNACPFSMCLYSCIEYHNLRISEGFSSNFIGNERLSTLCRTVDCMHGGAYRFLMSSGEELIIFKNCSFSLQPILPDVFIFLMRSLVANLFQNVGTHPTAIVYWWISFLSSSTRSLLHGRLAVERLCNTSRPVFCIWISYRLPLLLNESVYRSSNFTMKNRPANNSFINLVHIIFNKK